MLPLISFKTGRKTPTQSSGQDQWISLLKKCLTGPTLLETSGKRCQLNRSSGILAQGNTAAVDVDDWLRFRTTAGCRLPRCTTRL
jgi:hypothetical protein